MKWLVTSLDPFHDYQQQLEGFPDLNCLPSVCQMYNSSVTIAAPAAAGDGNWDASVIFTGIDATSSQCFIPSSGPTMCQFNSEALDGIYRLSTLTVLSDAAGVEMPMNSETAVRNHLHSRNIIDVPGRLIAVAYEVHNTTSVIEKQGSVVTAMVPSARDDRTVVNYFDTPGATSTFTQQAFTAHWLPFLPQSSDQVRTIPTSSQWDAAQGVYAIPRMNKPNIPIVTGRTNTGISVPLQDEIVGTYVVMHTAPAAKYAQNTTNSTVLLSGSLSSFSPTASYFSGLSNSSTLTVTLRAIVEYFPGLYSDLLLNATPSSTYDPLVLQAYNETSRAAPYAVPVDMNAGGKYFKMVLTAASQAAPAIANLLAGRPVASQMVRMIGSGASMLNDRMNNRVVNEVAPRRRAVPAGNKRKSRGRVVAISGRNRVVSRKAAGNSARPSR